jgi:hypothetical protein
LDDGGNLGEMAFNLGYLRGLGTGHRRITMATKILKQWDDGALPR